MVLIDLFLAFLRIGLFAVGGAYSFLPLIEKEVVQKYQWLTRAEFLDTLGMVKIFPGAISIKFATYVGYKIAGIPGALVANVGNLLAPVFLIIFASLLYTRYKNLPGVSSAFNMIQLAVFAMIIAVAFQLINIGQLIQPKNLVIVVVSFGLFMFTKIHPALILMGMGLFGIFVR